MSAEPFWAIQATAPQYPAPALGWGFIRSCQTQVGSLKPPTEEKYLHSTSSFLLSPRDGCCTAVHGDRLAELLRRPAELRFTGIKDDEGSLECDVAEDGETDTGVVLDTTETRSACAVDGREVGVGSRDGNACLADTKSEGRQLGATGEDISTLSVIVLGSGYAAVVGLYNV